MKIVHLCLCGPYNENWGYQENLIPKYHRKDGHEVTVIASNFVDSKSKVGYEIVNEGLKHLEDGIKLIRLSLKRILTEFLSSKARVYNGLYRQLEEEKPDIIFIHGLQFLDIITVGKYKRNYPNCILIADNHASYENSGNTFISRNLLHKGIYKFGINKVESEIKKIYSITPSCKKFLMDMYDLKENKIDYLYLGFDTDKINFKYKEEIKTSVRSKLDISNNEFLLVTGGKLSKGKNTDTLIDLFNEIEGKNVKLLIFGEFTEDIKSFMLKKIDSSENVIYIGWIDSSEVYKYFMASDVAVFLGTQSALWQQAIGSGVPIIVKMWDDIDYLDAGGNCIFLKEDEYYKFPSIIEKLIKNNDLLSRMKMIAETKGYTRFSYEHISRKAIDVFE